MVPWRHQIGHRGAMSRSEKGKTVSQRCSGGRGPRAQLVIIAAQVSPSNGQEGTTMTPHHTILCSQLKSTEHQTIPGNPGDNPNKPLCVQFTTISCSTEALWLLQCYPCTTTAPLFQHQNCLQQPLELVGDQFSDSNFSIISPLLLHWSIIARLSSICLNQGQFLPLISIVLPKNTSHCNVIRTEKKNWEISAKSGKTCCVCRVGGGGNTAIQVVSSAHPITNSAGTLPYSWLLPRCTLVLTSVCSAFTAIYCYHAHNVHCNTMLCCRFTSLCFTM